MMSEQMTVKKPRVKRVTVNQPPPMAELLGVKDLTKNFNTWWAKSFGVILAILIGYFAGILMARGEILDDCKINSVFRIGDQSFTCMRKM
jgi:hypothetical protein